MRPWVEKQGAQRTMGVIGTVVVPDGRTVTGEGGAKMRDDYAIHRHDVTMRRDSDGNETRVREGR